MQAVAEPLAELGTAFERIQVAVVAVPREDAVEWHDSAERVLPDIRHLSTAEASKSACSSTRCGTKATTSKAAASGAPPSSAAATATASPA